MATLTQGEWEEFFDEAIGAEVVLGSDTVIEWAGRLVSYIVKGDVARLTLAADDGEHEQVVVLGDVTFGVSGKTTVVLLPGRKELTVIYGV